MTARRLQSGQIRCEISPLVSYDGEDLDRVFLKPVELPYYLPSHLEMKHCFADKQKKAKPKRASMHFLSEKDGTVGAKMLEEELVKMEHLLTRVHGERPKHDYEGDTAPWDEQLPPTPPDLSYHEVAHEENMDDLPDEERRKKESADFLEEYDDEENGDDDEEKGQGMRDLFQESRARMQTKPKEPIFHNMAQTRKMLNQKQNSLLGDFCNNRQFGDALWRNTGRLAGTSKRTHKWWAGKRGVADTDEFGRWINTQHHSLIG